MQSGIGRLVRFIAGLAVILVGLLAIPGVWGSVVAVIGLVPMFASMARICLIAPLFGYTFDGQKRTGAMGS